MNKFKLLIIVTIFLSIFSISKVHAIINNYTLLGKVIYIDPGHGGLWKIQILRNDYKY